MALITALQLGILINGELVTSVTSYDFIPLCKQLLGSIPPPNVVKGNTIKLLWLNNTFQQIPDNVINVVIAQHAQTHICSLIESLLMSDT